MTVKTFISPGQNSLLNRNWRFIFGFRAGISVFSKTARIDGTTFQGLCVIQIEFLSANTKMLKNSHCSFVDKSATGATLIYSIFLVSFKKLIVTKKT